MSEQPTDAEIVAMLERAGGRHGVVATYVLKNWLRDQWKSVTTAWLRRQLYRMEIDGKVEKVPNPYSAVDLAWSVPSPHHMNERGREDE